MSPRIAPGNSVYLPFLRQPTASLACDRPICWVGEIGGESTVLAVRGPLAYLGEGHRLVVVDIADPTEPRRVGESDPLPGRIQKLSLMGDLAYVADGSGGLRVMDLSDPLRPLEVASLDTTGETRMVVVAESYAYLADGPGGLVIVDVSTPTVPRRISSVDTHQDANALVLRDGLAYIAIADPGSAGLSVVDVSKPAQPREVGAMATSGTALEVALNGHYAYIADGPAGLQVMDIADPARPRRLTRGSEETMVTGVRVHLGLVYMTGNFSFQEGVWIADLVHPASPSIDAVVPTRQAVSGLVVAGQSLYVTDRVDGLLTYEKLAGHAYRQMGQMDATGFWAQDAARSGALVYVTDTTGLRVIDISDPQAPRQVGRLEDLGAHFSQLLVEGRLAYVVASQLYLQIVDLSDPIVVRPRGRFYPGGTFRTLVVQGRFAYLAGLGGLDILDLSNPELPLLVGHLAFASGANTVAVDGDRAFVTESNSATLQALDISDPRSPRRIGSLTEVGNVFDITISDGHAYLADLDHRLLVVDVTNPTRMRISGGLNLPHRPASMQVVGTMAYVSNDAQTIDVVDVSDPAAPRWLGAYDEGNLLDRSALPGPMVTMSRGSSGLQILRLSSGLRHGP